MIWHHIYKAHHGVAQSSPFFSKSEFATHICANRRMVMSQIFYGSINHDQFADKTTNANRSQFQIHRFCFLHLHAGILLLRSMFFLNYFVPFVEIGFWYKFVHNLLILDRISNITRHICSEISALQYHKSDSRYN